jgi:hypothetical protein
MQKKRGIVEVLTGTTAFSAMARSQLCPLLGLHGGFAGAYTYCMESITLRNVSDLPGDEKRSLETLLKRPLHDGQRVFIMAFQPGVVPDEATRRDAQRAISDTLDQTEAHARGHGVTAEEADAAVEDVMKQVRPHTP